jgi:outer membrane protein assembly factor BamD
MISLRSVLLRALSPSRRHILALSALLLVAGCGGAPDQAANPYENKPVEELYNLALDNVMNGKYPVAAEIFDEVERQYPYSIWARRAMLMAAYCYYQTNKYDDAILAAQRYTSLYPGSRDAAYAYYLVAVSYYEQIVDIGRDQRTTELALQMLQEVVRRFPETEYARDARLKIDLTMDHLAGKEMDIGRRYLREDNYVAAINRFRTVVEKYQTTSHVPEALHRLTEAYLALGLIEEARRSAAVLGHNFPGSEWYVDSYALLKDRNIETAPAAERPQAAEEDTDTADTVSGLF